ncbi:hypothetical protein SAMN05444355_106130 [Flavobacterium frigoris]|uniref:Uncharacterized protein n=1 Tax=Flavobacterium frigoris TaxID=229204 RepID=A0A1H9KYD0_FLAFI|nr:hypothetical protein SAMN05444355_106130 [Flavobacterium frigoris]
MILQFSNSELFKKYPDAFYCIGDYFQLIKLNFLVNLGYSIGYYFIHLAKNSW